LGDLLLVHESWSGSPVAIATSSPVRCGTSRALQLHSHRSLISSCAVTSCFRCCRRLFCGASKSAAAAKAGLAELGAEPWDGGPIDPGRQVLMVRGDAVEKLARHPKHDRMTSHDLLALMQKEYMAGGGTAVKDDKEKPLGGRVDPPR
jgi:hypothetical protein